MKNVFRVRFLKSELRHEEYEAIEKFLQRLEDGKGGRGNERL